MGKYLKNKYVFVTILLAVIFLVGSGLTFLYVHYQEKNLSEHEFTVVTSFFPMYIAAENIIGDCEGVRLENLSEPQTGCLHDYQLTSADMKLLEEADVFVVNGGGIETFLTDVAEAYPDLVIINACEDVELLEDNAHAWMSLEKHRTQVQTICDGLMAADPVHEHGHTYSDNAKEYLEKIESLQEQYADLKAELEHQHVVLFHEAYDYVAEEFGMEVVGVMDLDEERQVSAGEVAGILSVIQSQKVSVILAEELYAKDMGDTMEKETDVKMLYLDPLTRGEYQKDSYLNGMRSNLELLKTAFQ